MNAETVMPGPMGQDPAPRVTRPVRAGTIVNGAIVLVVCAFVAQRTLAPGTLDTAAWLTAVVLGLGVLLLAVGVAAIVRQTKRTSRERERS